MFRTGLVKVLAGTVLACSAAAASAQNAWTTQSVNVRAGPDRTYPTVATLAPGYPVDVAGCLNDYSWCDVVFNNGVDRGWAPSRRLQYAWQGRRVPLYAYRASIGLPFVTFALGDYWDRYYRQRPWFGDRSRFYNAPRANWAGPREFQGRPPEVRGRPGEARQGFVPREGRPAEAPRQGFVPREGRPAEARRGPEPRVEGQRGGGQPHAQAPQRVPPGGLAPHQARPVAPVPGAPNREIPMRPQ